mgnify:CR=1 FL=1
MHIDWLANSERTSAQVQTHGLVESLSFIATIRAFQRANDRRLIAVVSEQLK